MYYLGAMSGTSMDAVDVACCQWTDNRFSLIATSSLPLSSSLKEALRQLQTNPDSLAQMAILDRKVGHLFAEAILKLLKQTSIPKAAIKAVGSHGQTLLHAPNGPWGYTLQIGDPNTIAAITGITTVADFRRRDVALKGQGAPLACGFHAAQMRSTTENRAVLNIGGIANLTFLPKDLKAPILGFDTGPGNTLMDWAARTYFQHDYDREGAIAHQGKADEGLLNKMLSDSFFVAKLPKSTGTDYFSPDWLQSHLDHEVKPSDLMATLRELTARSITDALKTHCPDVAQLALCGGGVKNKGLVQRLKNLNPTVQIVTTQDFGVDPLWVEAAAFAWLAKQTLDSQPGNCPTVTGASEAAILGGIYWGT